MTKQKIAEADMAAFPPYLSLFLLATLLLMISHGLAATVVFFYRWQLVLKLLSHWLLERR